MFIFKSYDQCHKKNGQGKRVSTKEKFAGNTYVNCQSSSTNNSNFINKVKVFKVG